jgi:glycosyltransferase involved in cell wall biosynthesis
MLEPWALRYRAWKKQLALHLYQRHDLNSASILFATAAQEAESLRQLSLTPSTAIIPNGVELPQISKLNDEQINDEQKYLRKMPSNVVFLSRIHPKKGLLNLIEAWGKLKPTGWRLRLAGPDEGGHLAQVMKRVRESQLNSSVEYIGTVEGKAKTALLASATLFVLPTYSENFGLVVVEALAHGVPVITTRRAPWEGLVTHGCGWWIEPTVDALTETLREAMALDNSRLHQMGQRGFKYARAFDWNAIAEQTVDVYHWVLGQGPRPPCVTTE